MHYSIVLTPKTQIIKTANDENISLENFQIYDPYNSANSSPYCGLKMKR